MNPSVGGKKVSFILTVLGTYGALQNVTCSLVQQVAMNTSMPGMVTATANRARKKLDTNSSLGGIYNLEEK